MLTSFGSQIKEILNFYVRILYLEGRIGYFYNSVDCKLEDDFRQG